MVLHQRAPSSPTLQNAVLNEYEVMLPMVPICVAEVSNISVIKRSDPALAGWVIAQTMITATSLRVAFMLLPSSDISDLDRISHLRDLNPSSYRNDLLDSRDDGLSCPCLRPSGRRPGTPRRRFGRFRLREHGFGASPRGVTPASAQNRGDREPLSFIIMGAVGSRLGSSSGTFSRPRPKDDPAQ